MPRSKILTKSIAVTPAVHEALSRLQETLKLRTMNDTVERMMKEREENGGEGKVSL